MIRRSFKKVMVEKYLKSSLSYKTLISEKPASAGCSSDIVSSHHFRPSNVTEHVTSRVSWGEFKTK